MKNHSYSEQSTLRRDGGVYVGTTDCDPRYQILQWEVLMEENHLHPREKPVLPTEEAPSLPTCCVASCAHNMLQALATHMPTLSFKEEAIGETG